MLVLALALPLSSIRSDFYHRIIDLLVQARKAASLTQAELGMRIGQRQTFVSKVELRERRLDVAEFILICRALEADPQQIIQVAENEEH
ncbi:MAG TPA: helix-turn-helix transcriptional regulator [Shinella sp.]|uniref:helix-turn-helix domain-containing protein n=1 Tax=Shinella sp. TaxID=1870904 RepID=UPI002E121F8D|nr:helix-turn-helix transcriptional regulator [Shinella sp.]